MSDKLRVIVLGSLGQTPFAGIAWQLLHYLEGFRRLGHDVYYLEDTGAWPYDPEQDAVTGDCGYSVRYLARVMDWYGMGDRWSYRDTSDHSFGLSESQVSRLVEGADVLVNLPGGTVLRAEHRRVPVRIYLETDPVEPQILVAQGDQFMMDVLTAHTHFFTYGENLGAPDCGVPLSTISYRPTRPPVVLDWWSPAAGDGASSETERFTTVASWRQSGKDVEWNGEKHTWSKHSEFLKFIDLPRRIRQPLELALAAVDPDSTRLLTAHGWRVVDALALSKDLSTYRRYVRGSSGEFTVAKDQYFRTRSGWFSDRSATYLAAGKPVITRDTAFGRFVPTGDGLFAFSTIDEILAAFDAIQGDYGRHSRAARAIAADYFDAEKVVTKMLSDAGV